MQATMSPCKGKSFKKTKAFAFAGRLYFILREAKELAHRLMTHRNGLQHIPQVG